MNYDFTKLAVARTRPAPLAAIIAALFGANATYNYRGGYPAGTNYGVASTPGAVNTPEIELDFAAIAKARVAAGQAPLAAGDILELFAIPAGFWALGVFVETMVVEGEVATVSVGDGVTPAGFVSAFDANALGFGGSLAAGTYSIATAGGKVYTVADTIDIVLNGAAFNVGKVRVMAVLVDLRAQR